MRRLAALPVVLGFVGALALCFAMRVSPAGADAPEQQGWWTELNPGVAGLAPPVPVPPDVPSNGLLVEGGPSSSSPVAFAALVYDLSPGSSVSTLTLQVASSSASTPDTTLELCSLDNPTINAEEGGPMSDAPSYDCSHKVTSASGSSGTSYQFDVSSLVSNATLAVAILPTAPTDRVVFNAPDTNSLAVPSPGDSGAASTGGAGSFSAGSLGTPSFSGGSGFSGSPGSGVSVPAIAGSVPSSGPASTASSTPAPSGSQNFQAFPAFGTVPQQAAPFAVALVLIGLLGGAALWIYAGRRRPDEAAA